MKRERPPSCPRCGYDQSGAVAAWGDACPVRGQCPECGLDFAWLDVMRPDRDRVPGFIEHAQGWRGVLAATPRTAWMALRPLVLFRRVQMHMRPRLGRAVLWAALVCIGMWTARAAVNSAIITAESMIPGMPYARAVARGTPLWYLVLVQWVHPFASAHLAAGGGLRWTWHFDEGWSGAPWLLLVSTCLWPLLFVLLPHTRRRSRVRWAHLARAFAYSWVWLLVLDLSWALYAVHSITRSIAMAAGWGGRASQFRTMAGNAALWLSDWERAGDWFVACVWAFIALWWLAAISRGFRLTHAGWVWATFAVINGLAVLSLWSGVWKLWLGVAA